MGGKCSIEDMWFIVHTVMDFCFLVDMFLSFRVAIPIHSDPIQVYPELSALNPGQQARGCPPALPLH